MTLAIWITLLGCAAASFYDLRWRRIPNVLTGTLVVVALVLNAVLGLHSFLICLAIIAGLTLVGTLLYSRGGIGGGDIKLAVAASAVLGYPLFVPFLLYSAIGGGLLALLILLFRASARAGISRAVLLTLSGSPGILASKRETLPYALAFVLGAIFIALSQSIAPFLRLTI
jgi:prepilin peptidase CpaA